MICDLHHRRHENVVLLIYVFLFNLYITRWTSFHSHWRFCDAAAPNSGHKTAWKQLNVGMKNKRHFSERSISESGGASRSDSVMTPPQQEPRRRWSAATRFSEFILFAKRWSWVQAAGPRRRKMVMMRRRWSSPPTTDVSSVAGISIPLNFSHFLLSVWAVLRCAPVYFLSLLPRLEATATDPSQSRAGPGAHGRWLEEVEGGGWRPLGGNTTPPERRHRRNFSCSRCVSTAVCMAAAAAAASPAKIVLILHFRG